jgi:hypothetical protein
MVFYLSINRTPPTEQHQAATAALTAAPTEQQHWHRPNSNTNRKITLTEQQHQQKFYTNRTATATEQQHQPTTH